MVDLVADLVAGGDAEYWQRIAMDRSLTIDDLCNRAWGAVYGEDHRTKWEYPAQAITHLIMAYREAKARIPVNFCHIHCQGYPLGGHCTYCGEP